MENIYRNENWKEFFISDALDIARQRIFVSDFGRVRIKDIDKNTFKFAETREQKGFLAFKYRDRNGYSDYYTIHRAVAFTFLTPKDESHIFVAHKDLNVHNNYFKNLKILDLAGLKEHHSDTKIFYFEERYREIPTSLTLEQIENIKQSLNNDATYGALLKLAKQYNVSTSQISQITLNRNWRHVESL